MGSNPNFRYIAMAPAIEGRVSSLIFAVADPLGFCARRAVPSKTASLLPPADACDPNESTAYFEPIRNDSDSTC